MEIEPMKVPDMAAASDRSRVVETWSLGMSMDVEGLVVVSVAVNEEPYFPVSLTLTLDVASTDRLAAFTAAHVGMRVQFLLGDEVVLAPYISTPIRGGVVVVTMGLESQALRIAESLQVTGATLSLRIVH